jgi:hypothetical protein
MKREGRFGNSGWSKTLIYSLLFLVFLFIAFNRHSKSGYYNYHSEIWADKAGYYMYLPAALKYRFSAKAFPENIDKRTGNGFILDTTANIVRTKYTYGVALLELPWFLVCDIAARILIYPTDGFSEPYHWSINLSGVSFLVVGLIFFYSTYRRRFSNRTTIGLITSTLLGTNLFYYGLDETGMSHVYTFALVGLLIELLDRFDQDQTRNRLFWFIGLIIGLIVLIRPINIVLLSSIAFVNGPYSQKNFAFLVDVRNAVRILAGGILIWIPQILYWHYAFDRLLFDSYQNESFDWSSPDIGQVLFAPNNGLFLYSPLLVLPVTCLAFMILRGVKKAVPILITFAVLTYVLSSWWLPSFGCSYGARNYVEYYWLLMFPFGWTLENTTNKTLRAVAYTITIFLIAVNIKLTYSYDGCFHGKNDWDWSEYYHTLFGPTK